MLHSRFRLILLLIVTANLSGHAQISPATIEGSVVRAASGQPLRNAQILLRRIDPSSETANGTGFGSFSRPVVTDSGGHFKIPDVEPGQYRISAEREGFIGQEWGQRTPSGVGSTFRLVAGQNFEADFRLIPAGVISGRIRSDEGEAISHVTVLAYQYQYSAGKGSLVAVASDQTDDRGEYRLFWLVPGIYYVAATPADQFAPSFSVAGVGTVVSQAVRVYVAGADAGTALPAIQTPRPNGSPVPIYYPGTADADSATPITLSQAAEVRGVDFDLRTVSTVTVSGRVFSSIPPPAPGDRPPSLPTVVNGVGGNVATISALNFSIGGIQVVATRVASGGNGASIADARRSAAVKPDGSYELQGVVPGSYIVTATLRQANQSYASQLRVEVGNFDVGNVNLALRAGIRIFGKITAPSKPPTSFRFSQIRVVLTSETPGIANAQAVAADDGSFTIDNVAGLEYRLRLNNVPEGGYVVSALIGSDDAASGPFPVAGDRDLPMQIEIGFNSGTVSATVLDPKGDPCPGASAVLIPDEPRRRRNDIYFSVPTDESGRVIFRNVPPGNYRLYAWETNPRGAYQDPIFMGQFEGLGTAVRVESSGTVNTETKLIRGEN